MATLKKWPVIFLNASAGLALGFATPYILFLASVVVFGGIAPGPVCNWKQTERRISPDRRLVAIGEIWTCEDDGDDGPRFTLDLASRTGQFEAIMYAVHLGQEEVPRFRWAGVDHLQIYASGRPPEFPLRKQWCGAFVESVAR